MAKKGRRRGNRAITNRDILDQYHDMACQACKYREYGKVTGHHIKTKGAGGENEHYNLIPLCYLHHHEIHTCESTAWFIEKYKLEDYMFQKGWDQCRLTNRWFNKREGDEYY